MMRRWTVRERKWLMLLQWTFFELWEVSFETEAIMMLIIEGVINRVLATTKTIPLGSRNNAL